LADASYQAFFNGSMGIGLTVMGLFRVLIINPGIYNYFTFRVVLKKESILLEKFSLKPMLLFIAKRCALAVLAASRVLRNYFKD
jgi:hypothetical protein